MGGNTGLCGTTMDGVGVWNNTVWVGATLTGVEKHWVVWKTTGRCGATLDDVEQHWMVPSNTEWCGETLDDVD